MTKNPKEKYIFNRKRYNYLRKKSGLTLEDLSMKAGVSLWTLCRYGTGKKTPMESRVVLAIAEALGCTVSDLYIERDGEYGYHVL